MPRVDAIQERNALIYERALDLNALEAPGIALASFVGFARGPGDYRAEALGFGVGSAPGRNSPAQQLGGAVVDSIVFTSQAAAQGLSFVNTNIPLHSPPGQWPASWRRRRRYVFEMLARVTAGPGATPAHMGIHATLNDLNGSTGDGVEWFAGSGVNAGRWTARYRRTNAPTVITNVADSGVAPGAVHHLAIVFNEAVPSVEWLLDGGVVATVTDPLNICNSDGTTVTNKLPSVGTGAGAAGTTLVMYDMRIRVFDPDFPLYATDFGAQTP